MKNKTLTIAASTGLILYTLYRIIQAQSFYFHTNFSPYTQFGQKLLYFLNSSIHSFGLIALGLCGLVLVYADLNKDKDLDFQKRITKIREIVFSALIIFSIWMIFYSIYNGITTYQIYLNSSAQSKDAINVSFLVVINFAVGIIISISEIILGLYIITKREGLLKPFKIIYFAGIAYTFVSRTYGFINAIIYNNDLLADASKIKLFGIHENRINSLTISFVKDILILAAGLIIVLYGIKKEKVIVKASE